MPIMGTGIVGCSYGMLVLCTVQYFGQDYRICMM